MYIVMHCMGIPFNGETIKNSSLGGSESAAYYVAKNLAAQGHSVILFTTHEQEGIWDGVKYLNIGKATEQTPLGDRFHYYAANTPHDVLIIQRHPRAFTYKWESKINLWWVHDLAQIRNRDMVREQLWNITGILTVSDHHSQQYCEAYGLNPETVINIQNGIDLSLFDGETEALSRIEGADSIDTNKINLLYSSRPERGLEHLVAPEGIMDKLAKESPDYHLYVCSYENTTPDMKGYYDYLNQRCDELSNVTMLGSLTKKELADVMHQCNAMVYPTPGPQCPSFDEVSCITAMECMAAGLMFISSDRGALPETCKDSGAILINTPKNGLPNINKFVDAIINYVTPKSKKYKKTCQTMIASSKKYDWSCAAKQIEVISYDLMSKNKSKGAMLRHLIRISDIYAAKELMDDNGLNILGNGSITNNADEELTKLYEFAWLDKFNEHYADYYQYEKDRGVDYGKESLDGNARFEHVASLIKGMEAGTTVLDYGCAHGHYTINLAKRNPDINFVGIDITASNIDKARKWAINDGVSNVDFIYGFVNNGVIEIAGGKSDTTVSLDSEIKSFDKIIAAEVVEHVADPIMLIDTLSTYLKLHGEMVITTPYGPWEAQGYAEHWPWRAHLHHLERADLKEMFGHHDNFNVVVAPSGGSQWGLAIGSYITTFNKPNEQSKAINYHRKLIETVPLQTISLCMIVKDAEDSIIKTLRSADKVVDEIIIAIDDTTTDRTFEVVQNYIDDNKTTWPVIKLISTPSPLEIGFDEARNNSIEKAGGDWILWLDSDEILTNAEGLYKYLHNNSFDGYALKQHHFTVEPLGVLKTDMPCRLFRNHKGIKFYGVVHEHPEKEMNEGVGHVQLIHDVEIAHQGYATERIRRGRFDRNIELLVRDREKYPERTLGKFLWVRDLAQMSQYELEVNGGHVTEEMRQRAKIGIEIWEELLEDNHLRMIVDGIDFYSTLSRILGKGFDFGFKLDASKLNGGVDLDRSIPIAGYFHSKEHILKLFTSLTEEKVKDYDSKYF